MGVRVLSHRSVKSATTAEVVNAVSHFVWNMMCPDLRLGWLRVSLCRGTQWIYYLVVGLTTGSSSGHFWIMKNNKGPDAWLRGLDVVLQTERSSLTWFPVRTRAWGVGQVPSWEQTRGNRSVFLLYIDVALPLFSLPFPPLKINNIFGEKKQAQAFYFSGMNHSSVMFFFPPEI